MDLTTQVEIKGLKLDSRFLEIKDFFFSPSFLVSCSCRRSHKPELGRCFLSLLSFPLPKDIKGKGKTTTTVKKLF